MIKKMWRFRNDDRILNQGGRKEEKEEKREKKGKKSKSIKPLTRWQASFQ
jgi:hypothetical protein